MAALVGPKKVHRLVAEDRPECRLVTMSADRPAGRPVKVQT